VSAVTDPLRRPIWSALTSRQAGLTIGTARAKRFPGDISPFAATSPTDPGALTEVAPLVDDGGSVIFLQEGAVPTPPGLAERARAVGVQLVAAHVDPPAATDQVLDLTAADTADMVALATLTRPGPFLPRTNTLGPFVGIRDASGALVAMAGERLAVEGHTEVSGVCTHPDARGRGYAALLSAVVATRILDRGEVPFLHAYATNRPAIGLYRRLGFTVTREVSVAAFGKPPVAAGR